MTLRHFHLSKNRIERRVGLHLTVDRHVASDLFRNVAGESHCTSHLLGGWCSRTSLRRETQHGHTRTPPKNLARQKASLNSDGSQLCHCGIGDDARIRKENHAVISE